MTENETPPVIFIDIYKSKLAVVLGRAQPWRWRAVSEGNRKKLASGESYTNREDCLDAIRLLFTSKATVFLRRREQDGWPKDQPLGLELLRRAA